MVCSIARALATSTIPAGDRTEIMRAAPMHRTGRSRLPPANTLWRMAWWLDWGGCMGEGNSLSRASSILRWPCCNVSLSMKVEYSKSHDASTFASGSCGAAALGGVFLAAISGEVACATRFLRSPDHGDLGDPPTFLHRPFVGSKT